MPNPTPLFYIEECPDLFVDACACDEQRNLVFLSAWGRDTALQEFFHPKTAWSNFTSLLRGAAFRYFLTPTCWKNAQRDNFAAPCSAACCISGCSIDAAPSPTEPITWPTPCLKTGNHLINGFGR